MSLQDELDKLKQNLLGSLQGDIAAALEKGREDIISLCLGQHVLKKGDRAPDVVLFGRNLEKTHLAELLGDKHLVLSFFRGSWCPYCDMELEAQEKIFPEIIKRNANLVAVSPELYKYSKDFFDKTKVSYDIYTDLNNRAAKEFGLVFEVPGDLREALLILNIDLEKRHGECDWLLPVPATFIINKNGMIEHAYVNADFTRRIEPADILAELDRLQQE